MNECMTFEAARAFVSIALICVALVGVVIAREWMKISREWHDIREWHAKLHDLDFQELKK